MRVTIVVLILIMTVVLKLESNKKRTTIACDG